MNKLVSLKAARERKKSDDYKRLVLKVWDDADHADQLAQHETAAEVNQKAREKL